MTGKVQPCLEQDHTASYFLWEGYEVRRTWPIQLTRGLPETAGIVAEFIDIRLVRGVPAHHRLAAEYAICRWGLLRLSQRLHGLQPYTSAPQVLQSPCSESLGPRRQGELSVLLRPLE